ncbi:MAG TPA: DUF1385 domain-containing protein [Candidatus Scybalocola faecavium]|nr:DUF1385 domain-containing protein [Candidatus Scybalocola faecavium]
MKYAKIGGQAVIEGVMMRYGNDYAVTVRKPDGNLEVKKGRYEGLVSRLHLTRVPIIRGVFAFIDSMVLGISTLTYSASFYEDEEEQAEKEKSSKSSLGEKLIMAVTVALSLVIAIGLFMVLPFFISDLFRHVTDSSWLLGIIEGIVRVILFMAYIFLISRMKDIQRVFMYHGAEHKSINCIEHGAQLTPENAMKYSRFHKRCGTSFLFIVIFLSIVFFILFFQIFPVENRILKVVIRILLVPVIAGVAYEVIQWAGRSQCRFANVISRPGMALQKLTTREPDESMIEAAIASIEAIYDWRAFQEEVRADEQNDIKTAP